MAQETKQRTILVAGATGHQGGALVKMLLERGHQVRALTRKPASDAARAVASWGAEVVEGEFGNRQSLVRSARGVDAFFAMATPFEGGPDLETRHAIEQAEAAKEAGVPHLVYSSVASADQNTGIPHFDSKAKVERHIQGLGVPFTIVAPVFFMENFQMTGFLEGLRQGRLATPLPPTRSLQMIPLVDLATFVTLVIEAREEFFGRRIDLASDEVTMHEAAEALSSAIGRRIDYVRSSIEEVRRASADMARMFEWFDAVGYHAEIAALRREHTEVRWHWFHEWARSQDWRKVLGPPPAEPRPEMVEQDTAPAPE